MIDKMALIALLLRLGMAVAGCGLFLALIWLAAAMFEAFSVDEW